MANDNQSASPVTLTTSEENNQTTNSDNATDQIEQPNGTYTAVSDDSNNSDGASDTPLTSPPTTNPFDVSNIDDIINNPDAAAYLDEISYPVNDADNWKQADTSGAFVEKIINNYNKAVRAKVLKDDLVPELIANERQKRNLKKDLMEYIKNTINIQSVLICIPIIFITFSSVLKSSHYNDLETEKYVEFLSFLKYYIGAVIVEFITMLFFIVKYVFDKSISELVKEYKKDD